MVFHVLIQVNNFIFEINFHILENNIQTLTKIVGTVGWCAPELLNISEETNLFTEKSDIYSFGIVLWVIFFLIYINTILGNF